MSEPVPSSPLTSLPSSPIVGSRRTDSPSQSPPPTSTSQRPRRSDQSDATISCDHSSAVTPLHAEATSADARPRAPSARSAPSSGPASSSAMAQAHPSPLANQGESAEGQSDDVELSANDSSDESGASSQSSYRPEREFKASQASRTVLPPYALPSTAKRRREEEAAWARAFLALRPWEGNEEERNRRITEACKKFIDEYQQKFTTRCRRPTSSFANKLYADWTGPSNVDKLNIFENSDDTSIKAIIKSLADKDFIAFPDMLNRQLADLATTPLTKKNLEEHLTSFQQPLRLLDASHDLTDAVSSSSSSSTSSSSRAPHDAVDVAPLSPPPNSEQFIYQILPEAGTGNDKLRGAEETCMLDGLTTGGMERCHIIPHRPTKRRLLYALKMYYLLSAKLVKSTFELNHISNLFYLQPTWHVNFDRNRLVVFPSLPFLRHIDSYLDCLIGPFSYDTFLAALPADLPLDKLTYSVLALDRSTLKPFTVKVDPETSTPPGWTFYAYTCSEDAVFRRCDGPALPEYRTELPPRLFLRTPSTSDTLPNPLLFIMNAAHKLTVRHPPKEWPSAQEDTFLLIMRIVQKILSRAEHDEHLYSTAVDAAMFFVSSERSRKRGHEAVE
ncbi:hypothetical protein JCM10207_004955 [Rhodosporidiobolus poonsookiae]